MESGNVVFDGAGRLFLFLKNPRPSLCLGPCLGRRGFMSHATRT